MSTIHWLEVPIQPPTGENLARVTKYEVGNAVLVHGTHTAYVGIADQRMTAQLLAHPDVRELSPVEREKIQPLPGLPVTWESLESQIPDMAAQAIRRRPVGLGDAIAALTRRARIQECGSCARRRRGLNRITIWGWWRSRPDRARHGRRVGSEAEGFSSEAEGFAAEAGRR
ncbi:MULTISPECIES: hypothetical protein [Streptomyces]|uniref:CarD-like/TRCF RNAP-interacting domain-containing protein n=1 Tax=Streptomyces ramulosus TaxID=47762 RepID=A0ABW1FNN7_9ACTN